MAQWLSWLISTSHDIQKHHDHDLQENMLQERFERAFFFCYVWTSFPFQKYPPLHRFHIDPFKPWGLYHLQIKRWKSPTQILGSTGWCWCFALEVSHRSEVSLAEETTMRLPVEHFKTLSEGRLDFKQDRVGTWSWFSSNFWVHCCELLIRVSLCQEHQLKLLTGKVHPSLARPKISRTMREGFSTYLEISFQFSCPARGLFVNIWCLCIGANDADFTQPHHKWWVGEEVL